MLDENKVAIAKTVMGNSERLLALIPTDKGLLIETLFYADEVKEMPKEPARTELNEQELTMAKTLISNMVQEFESDLYHDEYQVRLRQIIEDKIAGKEIVQTPAEQPSNVIDIMEALKASIEAQKQETDKPKRGRPRKSS